MEIYPILIGLLLLIVSIVIAVFNNRKITRDYEYSKHLYKYYHIQRELTAFIIFNWEKCSEDEWKLTKDFEKSIDEITEYIENNKLNSFTEQEANDFQWRVQDLRTRTENQVLTNIIDKFSNYIERSKNKQNV